MSRRPPAPVGTEPSGRITSIESIRARLLDVDVDRKKRIDDSIDYFGGAGQRSIVALSAAPRGDDA